MNFGFCNIAKLFLYLFALVLLVDGKEDPGVIRGKLTALISQGDFGNMMTYLEQVERDYGTLNIDEEAPSLFSYKGIALHNAHRGKEAMEAFRIATTLTTKDSRAWINLGEQSSQLFFLNEAVDAYREAYKMGDGAVLPRLLHVQAWAGVWEGFEELAVEIEYLAKECVANVSACKIDSTTAFEYTDIPGWISKQMHQNAPNAKASHHMMRESDIAPLWPTKPHKSNVLQANAELTVGASGTILTNVLLPLYLVLVGMLLSYHIMCTTLLWMCHRFIFDGPKRYWGQDKKIESWICLFGLWCTSCIFIN